MRQVNVHEAKTQLSALLEAVEAGESVVIARAGEPVAILTAFRPSRRRRRLGLFAGQGEVGPDFDEIPSDIAAAFEGRSG